MAKGCGARTCWRARKRRADAPSILGESGNGLPCQVNTMNNFTAIRNGIRQHIKAGKLSPFDLGIYVFLLLWADWATGIYLGCALGIACQFNDPRQKEPIQKSLRRLRDHQYINYKKGDGSRKGYPILIDKYEPTVGELIGKRLNAWKHGELAMPEYVPKLGHATVKEQTRIGKRAGAAPIQDYKTLDVKTQDKSSVTSEGPDFLSMWNLNCGKLPRIRKITGSRALKLRMLCTSEPSFAGDFVEAVKKASTTAFLLGENNRGWKANFDWLIRDDTNYMAVLEGKYDGKRSDDREKSGAFHDAGDPTRYGRGADAVINTED
jgi:hypothetical protein